MNKPFENILDRLDEEREISYADFDLYVNEYSPCLDSEYDDLFHRGLERAVRIIKDEITNQGGVDDDCCEWEQFNGSLLGGPHWLYETTCGKIAEDKCVSPKDFKYCPYCSKKIKVVE